MAMTIYNNLTADKALCELNKNSGSVGKLLKKIATGLKIVGADDDSSAYAISEKMREQIRSLEQDNQNVQNGSALFKIAVGGIDNIIEELRNLKELAINSANDTNNDSDRLIIQKEFQQKMADINDIATETNYNTKRLLDGTYGRGRDTGNVDYSVSANAYEPTNYVATISGDYDITQDGVYRLVNGNANINIKAKNVKIVQADPEMQINNVYITGAYGGKTNLWIKDFNLDNNNRYKNFIKFNGKDNILNFEGTNNIHVAEGEFAVINVGGGLTVEGGSDGTGIFNYSAEGNRDGAFIGGNQYEDLSKSDITINSGNFNTSAANIGAAFIGSAYRGAIGDIYVNGGTFIDTCDAVYSDALIGGGGSVGNIFINNAHITAENKRTDPVIGITNGSSSKMGDITITNSYVCCKGINLYAPAIGVNGYANNAVSGNITIDNCKLDLEVSGGGAGIGTGMNTTVDGDIIIRNTNLNNIIVTGGGEIVGKGFGGNVTGSIIIGGDSGKIPTAIKIHHGTKSNQNINFYIEDMHTKSLGTGNLIYGNLPTNENDLARYYALAYDDNLQSAWLDTLKSAQNKSLDDINVITKQNANTAIRVLDGAIESALNESTRIGAYLQRLEYTDSNIVTMNENVQAAESTIRDADMAKEMTAYTKFNVLQQASQSMLAQANQNSSAVLSLLQ